MFNCFPASRLCAAAAALALGACSSIPVYTAASGDQIVRLKLSGPQASMTMCRAGVRYVVPIAHADDTASIVVPAAERITLQSNMVFVGYNVTSRCYPSLSLVPDASAQAIVNTGLYRNSCYIEVVREDMSTPTGVAIEPTVDRPRC